jgi:hypothetical protein
MLLCDRPAKSNWLGVRVVPSFYEPHVSPASRQSLGLQFAKEAPSIFCVAYLPNAAAILDAITPEKGTINA